MKILYRYFMKEYLSSFLLGLFLFIFIFVMDKIFILSELLVAKQVAFFYVIKLFICYLPATFAITIPMGVLAAILITWGRLSANNEITAIKAAGISLNSLIYLALFLALFFFLLNAILNDTLLPHSNHAYKNLYYQIAQKKPTISIEEQIFTKIDHKEIYVNKIDNKKNIMLGIYLYEKIRENDGDILFRYIFAKKGYWKEIIKRVDQEKILTLKEGTIHQTVEKERGKYHVMKFDTHEIVFNFSEKLNQESYCKGLREMTSRELREKIKEYKKRDIDVNPFLVELYKKISIPFACVVFSLVGIPLGLLTKRSGRSIGLGFSILIIFIYYLILVCGETLGEKGALPPLFSMWLPNIVLGSVGIILCLFAIRR